MLNTLWLKIESKLIENWRCAHKLITVWLATAMLIISTSYEYLPVFQQYLPDTWVSWMAGAIIVARIIKQSRLKT